MRREFVCVRHSISKLEPITGRKSETAIPRNIDGSRIGKTRRRSRYYSIIPSCSRHGLLAKCPKKGIGTRDFRVKIENERFSVTCSRGDLVISRGRYAKDLKNKIRAAREARLFMIF